MKKILCLLAITILVVSCGKKPSEASFIPKDATGVMYVNLESLYEKSKDVDFKNLNINKMITQSAPQKLKDFMAEQINAENIKTTFRNDMMFGFMKTDGGSTSGALIIPIQNASSFEKMIAPMLKDMPRAEKQENVGKDNAFTVYTQRDAAIGWNETTALFMVGSRFAGQDLIDLTKLASSENIYATDYFKDFIGAGMDMGIHITSSPVKDLANSLLSIYGVNLNLGDNNFSYHGSFEDDRVLVKSNLGLNDDLKSLTGYKTWAAKGYNADLLNVLPENPLAVVKVSLNTSALYKHIESLQENKLIPELFRKGLKMNLENTNNQMESAMGMSIADVANVFDGSMMIAFTEGKTVKDSIIDYYSDDYRYKVFDKKVPFVYGAVAIKETENFEKLMNIMMTMQRPKSTKGKNYYQLSKDVFALLKNDILFVTNDVTKADEVYNNGKLATNLSEFKYKANLDNSIYVFTSENLYSNMSEMFNSFDPYAFSDGNEINTNTETMNYSEFFGDSHMMMNADGMEAYYEVKGEGGSLKRTIEYMDATMKESLKMMSRY
ncbi:DUF4836 family protein [Kordia sp.]|uniref:DUF4836 family protein n=1 Tax=Kordia sp. TaxID=1965332 RepID=UPI0025C1C2F9|nr:DUF4836 family protein [Kordia sp.]MCH2195907.1 DUF4836 family protein [Kordia sp.]